MIGRRKIKKEDAGALLQAEGVCAGCLCVFNLNDEGDLYWIKGDDPIPFIRCRTCYPNPDDVMKAGNWQVGGLVKGSKSKKKITGGPFSDLFE